jgi:thiol-disulfide isomerase/thioredoxin
MLLCLGSFLLTGCSREIFPGPDAVSGVATLGVGDPAPELNLDEWFNGPPATTDFEGNVHVVEFWATWCGPCRVSMPHLSELQEAYGDQVTIIGITDEDPGMVEAFLASESTDGRAWSDIVKYHLATDQNQQTSTDYMKAANQRGIPTAFIVGRDAKIKWIGHPGRIDEPLRKVVEGS